MQRHLRVMSLRVVSVQRWVAWRTFVTKIRLIHTDTLRGEYGAKV
jgi:hypothetical protein